MSDTLVHVTASDVPKATYHGSITRVPGTTEDGRRVVISGDTRPMSALLEAALVDGEAQAEVPDWALGEVPTRPRLSLTKIQSHGLHHDTRTYRDDSEMLREVERS